MVFKNIITDIKKEEKKTMGIAILLWTLWSLFGASIMIVKLLMVKNIMEPSFNISNIYYYWVAIIGIIVFKGIIFAFANIEAHFAGYKIVGRLRRNLVSRLKMFSMGFYTKERLGDISTVIHQDVDRIESLVAHLGTRMISDIFVSLIIAIGLFIVDWRMGLALISLLPVAFIILLIGQKRGGLFRKVVSYDMREMVSSFVEYLKGIPVIKSFTENPMFINKLNKSVIKFEKSSSKEAKIWMTYIGGYMFFMELCYGVLIALGLHLFLANEIDFIVYVIFAILGKEFYKPFANAETYWVFLVKARDSYGRILKVLEYPIVETTIDEKKPENYNIKFENVEFEYEEGNFKLDNCNFDLGEGTLTALVGTSGSGKTTVTNLLLRFWDVKNGSIKIGNIDIRDIDYDDLLSEISIVMQNVILFNDTILENIKIGNKNASFEDVKNAAKNAMIHNFIMSLPDGYNTILGENGAGLSGGQKQRLSIARAFLKDAPIIILDEATSNIDPFNERKIQQAISNLAKGRTLIVIAHHLHTIKNADTVLVFDKGKLCEIGNHNELINNKKLYSQLWKSQYKSKVCTVA